MRRPQAGRLPGTRVLYAVGPANPDANDFLTGVVATPAGLGNRTLIERHRNGGWHQVGSPTPDSSGSFLTGLVAFSQTRAAAVGYRTPARFRTIALIYR